MASKTALQRGPSLIKPDYKAIYVPGTLLKTTEQLASN